jgi:integrase
MALTDVQIRKVLPGGKPQKLFDAGGLFLLVQPTGSKLWRLKYRLGGKERLLALGAFDEVTLKQARAKRDEARKLIADGVDPSQVRKAETLQRRASAAATEREAAGLPMLGSFEAVAREWVELIHKLKVSTGHAARTLIRFEQDVFPWMGSTPIANVTAPQLLVVLRRVEARGAIETTHRIKDACSQVFRYGIACGKCERDPARDLRDALKPVNTKHMAAVTDPKRAGELMRAITAYSGLPVTRAALALAPLVFQRPGNLRAMEWAEVDLERAMWTIPASKMKRTVADKAKGDAHDVPLCRQAVAILRDLEPLTGHGRYVFPSIRGGARPMSDMTLNGALQRLGFDTKSDMTTHGFRAMARTMLSERLGMPEAVIEAQLAHSVKDGLGRAYNRTTFAEQRRTLMQAWADYLDDLRKGADVLPYRAA